VKHTSYLCPRCLGLLGPRIDQAEDGTYFCRVCQSRFVNSPTHPPDDIYKWLADWWLKLELPDVAAQKRELQTAADGLEDNRIFGFPALDVLLTVLSKAKHHVHFMTWGISPEVVGALKLLCAMGVQVCGIVANARDYLINDLAANYRESLSLEIVSFPQRESWDKPHIKLIVVDGLLAITGSANLTLAAWRKVSSDGELVSFITDEDEVVRIHNRYFSSAWLKYGRNRYIDLGPEIVMSTP
jgi:phosphatidylserine/phosphatidylglycerophosphate/cardiolipin synthase-like enzyme